MSAAVLGQYAIELAKQATECRRAGECVHGHINGACEFSVGAGR